MPSPGNVPLSFNRDRIERQLDARFEELLAKLRKNRPAEDPWIVRRGYEIATERHRDQSRISGDPYLTHLLEVAHILADLRLDATTLTAALVHDVRGVLVKLADRLHNMRTLEYLEPAKQQRISRETLDIYAPIAHRLGMSIIRGELEDLSFRYLESEAFFALQKEVIEKAPIHGRFLEEVQTTIRSKLVENGIPAELEARVKGLYSLNRKILRQARSLAPPGCGS